MARRSRKPKIKAVQDPNREHDRASEQESPQALFKASKDVRQPRNKARLANNCCPIHD